MPMNSCELIPACNARAQSGFTMLEVLVALLILLVGLLGLAGLLVTTQQGEVEAYQRKQAAVLLQDMIDRITANPKAATCYADPARVLGTGYSGTPTCTTGTGSAPTRAVADLTDWHNALLGTSEKKGTANVGSVIDARGCITSPSTGVYVVSVAWRGLQPTGAPLAAYTCAQNLYLVSGVADDRVRRVISVTIRIANLST